MPRELHPFLALDGAGHRPAESLITAHRTDLIGLAEQGALDFVTVGDSLAPPPDDSAGRLDAVTVLARVAPLTSRIGLVPTVTTTHTEAEARAVGRREVPPAAELWAEAADAAEVAARLWDSWEDDAEIRQVGAASRARTGGCRTRRRQARPHQPHSLTPVRHL
ncbi:LLM class flavin-dependent oxidoreductase [Streptomyces sp. F001]|nr:LLM class flavin-dependent oxidoreductase [Streptomyces sp. F001]